MTAAVSNAATSRESLLRILKTRSYEKKRVTLASGRESDFFIDCKQAILTAEGHACVGELMFARASSAFPEATTVAGVELGGCPLASAVALVSHQQGRGLDALYVRKEVKDHGSKRRVEGDKSIVKGVTKTILLEDVITTGGSTLKAKANLEAEGVVVVGVIVLVDRQEGGREALEAAGMRVEVIFVRSEFENSG